jgi:Coenzyme PQQ synthesis protein D (PqqD)
VPLRYGHQPKITTRIVDGEAIVISQHLIKHLNQVASIIWLSLTKPATERELLEILKTVYPDQNGKTLRKDIRSVLRQLFNEGFAKKLRT